MALTMRPSLLGSGKMTLTQAESAQGHGAVSEYETLNLPRKPHQFSPLAYSGGNDGEEEDLVPQYHPPSPVKPSTTSSLLTSDPSLCLTPEHPRSKAPFRPLGSRRDTTLTSKKVRFTVDGQVVGQGSPNSEGEVDQGVSKESVDTWSADDSRQEYDPSFYSDPGDVDFEAERPRTLSYRVGGVLGEDGEAADLSSGVGKKLAASDHLNTMHTLDGGAWKPYKSLSQSQAKDGEKTQQKRSARTSEMRAAMKQSSKQPVSSKASHLEAQLAEEAPVPAVPPVPVVAEGPPYTVGQRDKGRPPVLVLREVPPQPRLPQYSFPFSQPGEADSEPVEGASDWEHVLARPEYNSTLHQVAEINQAKMAQPDVLTSMEKILEKEETRTEINEKAAAKVNRAGELFSGLTLVDLPQEHLCQQLEQERLMKAPPPRPTSAPSARVRGHREPDLMEFFSERSVRDVADFSLNIPAPSESLSTADPYLAFDLYRHSRSWEED